MIDFIVDIIKDIRITDIVDIVIVSFITYKILGFIKETRAQQLVKGLLVLLFAFFISDIFQLYTLNWILRGTMTMGIIAIVIVFQPELRRGLEYMGRGKIMNNPFVHLNQDESKKVIDALINTIKKCSEMRTGVLIIIERQVSLGEFAETGTILEAEISSHLLENIFYEGAPLHDGAVIVRGKRIYAAGCVLPLTHNNKLNKNLGTRHRAGIGITECSDAITLIVSEETGVISVADGGNLKRYMSIKSLEKLLNQLYLNQEEELSFFDKLKKIKGGSNVKI